MKLVPRQSQKKVGCLTPSHSQSLKIRTAANKFLNNKSPYSDRNKYEMIKSSLNELVPIYLQLFNAVLKSGIMPQTWSYGLITSIF